MTEIPVGEPPTRRETMTEEARDALTSDGYGSHANLGAHEDAPPAYGEFHDQINLSQPGFEAGAAVTDDGRVNININQKNLRLSELLAPTLYNQLAQQQSHPDILPPAYIPPSLGGQPGQSPPARLNVVIQIVGSRGDVQPFVALGKVLKDDYGHRVRLATHVTFKKFVEENGLEFFNIGGDPAELMAFMVKNPGLMPGLDALKSGEITKRRKGIEEIILGCWRSCIEPGNGTGPALPTHKMEEPVDEEYRLPGDPNNEPFVADAIIANPPSFAHIHIAEKLGIPLHMMFTMPWSPTRAFPHPLANIQSTNTDPVMTNYMSYAMVEMMTWQGLGDVINRFRTQILDLEPLSLIWAPGLIHRLRIPYTYCWSPTLIPKPNDWLKELTISGFFFLNLASNYQPEPELAEFLAAGPPPVYIGFGSIVVDNPNQLTRMIFDAVATLGIRALVSKGWGGLGADSVGIPEGVFMLGNVPHDWLFQHVSAVVHHGGAGTTAAGIKAGRPTVVVPFFGDQPFWGSMIHRAGAGPAPVPYKQLTAESLATAIGACLKPEALERAKILGETINKEQGADLGAKSFNDFLNCDTMRCSLAPSRVAVWRVRRSQIKLSALAAAVLVGEGKLKQSDLKLVRHREYNTEDQPWDPVTAVTSAFVGDIGSITMAIADFPRDIYRHYRPKNGSNPPTPAEELNKDGKKDAATPSASTEALAPATPGGADAPAVPDTSDAATVGSTTSLVHTISGSSTDVTSSGQTTPITSPHHASSILEWGPVHRSHSEHHKLHKTPPEHSPERGDHQAAQLSLDAAVEAGKGVGRIVGTAARTPMNFCMGVARGLRNAPKLYHDDTVRPQEKVTDLASGLRTAGKEFGFGMYDGISGLVTQPYRGAEKEGAVGFIKGFGKGIGGIMLKPAAAIWSLPAYAMQGLNAQMRNAMNRSSMNWVIVSRVVQGRQDLAGAGAGEKRDIILRWESKAPELKQFYTWRVREAKKKAGLAGTHWDEDDSLAMLSPNDSATDLSLGPEPKTGWFHTRHLSMDERRRLHAQKEAWKKAQAEHGLRTTTSGSSVGSSVSLPGTSSSAGSGIGRAATYSAAMNPTAEVRALMEEDEFEHAIRASVRQTSRGDPEEDARIEHALRASVREMRRISDAAAMDKGKSSSSHGGGSSSGFGVAAARPSMGPPLPHRAATLGGSSAASTLAELPGDDVGPDALINADAAHDAHLLSITDQEYEDLIAQAVQRSVAEHAVLAAQGPRDRGGDSSDEEHNEMLRKALEESKQHQGQETGIDDEEHQRLLQKAIEESKQHHQEQAAGVIDDEEHQKLLQKAIEESKQHHQEQGAGVDDEEHQKLLQKAIEESKRLHEERLQQGGAAAEAGPEHDEELLRSALAESEKAHLAELEKRKTEEDIVLEYVKRQSLAEEEFRQRQREKGKGAAEAPGVGGAVEEEHDEELRKALEMSLRADPDDEGGPSTV